MDNTPVSPLEQARTLVAALRAQTNDDTTAATLATITGLLQQASDDLTQASAAVETLKDESAKLNSVMVHEIRKPMTSIRGYADMLAKPGMVGPLNAMQQQFIETIRANVIALEGLVSNISDFNKLQTGRLKLNPKVTPTQNIVNEVKKHAEPLAAQFEHTLSLEAPETMPEMNLEAGQIAKITSHLVRNACMYTPKGGQITVKFEPNEGELKVTVKDSGIGMKPEEQSRLGEPFYRADHELVTSQKGYGLSLPVVMGLLALMNSKLEIESNPESGSTLIFIIKV